MNPEICRNCDKCWVFEINFKVYNTIKFSCLNIQYYMSFLQKNEFYNNAIEIPKESAKLMFSCSKGLKNSNITGFGLMFRKLEISSEKLNKALKDIELDKFCPYYMEHLMNDWNIKNES